MYIKVWVKTKAKAEYLEKKKEDFYLISVKEKAERNMANSRALEVIALYLKVPKNKIKIISGHHHPHKIFSVDL